MAFSPLRIELEKHRHYVKSIEEILRMTETVPQNKTEMICQVFLKCQGAAKGAEFLNDDGHRVETDRGSRKYISKDITAILDDPDTIHLVNRNLYEMCMMVHKKGKRYSTWTDRLVDALAKMKDDANAC